MDEDDLLRNAPVGRSQRLAAGRAGRRNDALELERVDDVLIFAVTVFGVTLNVRVFLLFADAVELVPGRDDDGADFDFDQFVLVVEVDRVGGALLLADAAKLFAVLHTLEAQAVFRVDRRARRNRLRERNVNRGAFAELLVVAEPEVEVERVVDFTLHRASVPTGAATGAFRNVDVARLFADRYLEVADEAFDFLDFAVRHQLDVRVLADFDHTRRQNALRAVERRERFGEPRHLAADRRLFFDDDDLDAPRRDVERRLNPRDAGADHERALRYRDFDRLERVVATHLFDRHSDQFDRFRGRDFAVGVNPRALLADVRHFDQIRIEARVFRRFAERLQVHMRRAARDDDAGEPEFLDLFGDHILTRLGTHILIIQAAVNAGELSHGIRHCVAIHVAGDVLAAPTRKNANLRHLIVSFVLIITMKTSYNVSTNSFQSASGVV